LPQSLRFRREWLGFLMNSPKHRPTLSDDKLKDCWYRVKTITHGATGRELTVEQQRRVTGIINWVRRLHPNHA
jgi:hypothetical protein